MISEKRKCDERSLQQRKLTPTWGPRGTSAVSGGAQSSRPGFVLCGTKVIGSSSRIPRGLLGQWGVCGGAGRGQAGGGEEATEEGDSGDSTWNIAVNKWLINPPASLS